MKCGNCKGAHDTAKAVKACYTNEAYELAQERNEPALIVPAYEDTFEGPRLWDAGEGVCCAAYQLGACQHTENAAQDAQDALDAQVPCDGVCRDGIYYGAGYVLNGKFVGFTGTCYRCGGKGYQTPEDVKRNTYYDNNVRRIYA